jgi:hypothetical protein
MLTAAYIDPGGIRVHDFQCLPVYFLLGRPLRRFVSLFFPIHASPISISDSGLGPVPIRKIETHQRGQTRS